MCFTRQLLCCCLALYISSSFALDYEIRTPLAEDGSPITIGKLKILSVYRLFPTTIDDQEMVELSGLAWSRDDNILYALNDHGAIFHFRPEFNKQGLADIHLLAAYALHDVSNKPLGFPWSDSEGLYLENGDNGQPGDDELLISFELKPRLQWHRPDGRYIKKEPLPEWMGQRSSYHSWSKALESVAIHPEHGVLTAPEYPMEGTDWSTITLYGANGNKYSAPSDVASKMAICAIEVMPDGDLLVLQRRHRLLAPTWTTALVRLSLQGDNRMVPESLAEMQVGGLVPMDNYEGLTRHTGNRYFMISDDNESFMQQTLLVYFEVLP